MTEEEECILNGVGIKSIECATNGAWNSYSTYISNYYKMYSDECVSLDDEWDVADSMVSHNIYIMWANANMNENIQTVVISFACALHHALRKLYDKMQHDKMQHDESYTTECMYNFLLECGYEFIDCFGVEYDN